jgi:hypothetical protein
LVADEDYREEMDKKREAIKKPATKVAGNSKQKAGFTFYGIINFF